MQPITNGPQQTVSLDFERIGRRLMNGLMLVPRRLKEKFLSSLVPSLALCGYAAELG